jgi:hypothetical protein
MIRDDAFFPPERVLDQSRNGEIREDAFGVEPMFFESKRFPLDESRLNRHISHCALGAIEVTSAARPQSQERSTRNAA